MFNIKVIGASLAVMGIFAGCAETEGGGIANPISDLQAISGGSTAQGELSSQQQAYARARISASVGTAAAAGMLCVIRNCSVEERNQAILAGAVAGYLAGGYLTNRDAEFQGTQETLQRDIQVAREDNARLRSSVSAASNVVAFQKSQIDSLNRGLRQGTTSVAQYRAEVQRMKQDVAATRQIRGDAIENVAGLDNSIQRHRAAGLSTNSLEQERSAQLSRIEALRREERRMLNNIASAPAEVRA